MSSRSSKQLCQTACEKLAWLEEEKTLPVSSSTTVCTQFLHSMSNLIDNCQIRNQSHLETTNLEHLKAIQNISEIVLKTQ